MIGPPLFIKLISIAIVALFAISASPARAQDAEKARELFQQGSKYYDLGQFDKAIEAWQQGYDQKPDPGFLYNIAQAYRQKQDAAKAIFFYKGYLRNSPKAKNRSEVDQKIAALQKQLDAGGTGTTTPPPGNGTTTPPTTTTTTTTTTATTPVTPPPGTSTLPPPTEPPPAYGTPPPASFGEAPPTVAVGPAPASAVGPGHLELNAGIGPAFWQTGVDGSAAPSFVFNMGAGWLFGAPTSRLRFRLGAMFGYTFLAANEDKSNVGFVSLLADPALEIRLTESGRLYLDLDLAIGLQWATGIQRRSKLLDPTVPIMSVDGPQGMAQVRAGAGMGYRFTPQLAVYSSLSQSSSPKKQYFYSDIKRVEWLFGLAYRF
ncbi:MAG TPA: hypothetical protein VIF57_23055 [Polyangia bacterium]